MSSDHEIKNKCDHAGHALSIKETRGMPDRAQPGFTLLELMFTLLVLAILAAVGVPAMNTMMERNRLKSAAQALTEDLQWARGEAIRRNDSLRVVIDDDGVWCYGIELNEGADCDCNETDPDAAEACTLETDDIAILKRVTGADYPGVTISTNQSELVFEPRRGIADQGGSVTLISPDNEHLQVILSPLGHVRVCWPDDVGAMTVPGYASCD